MRRSTSAAIASVAIVLALVPAAPARSVDAPAIDWQPCTLDSLTDVTDFECGRLEVPRDRTDPSAGTFSLAVARHRSTGDPAARLGSILMNPGGPGGSGLQALPYYWWMLPDALRSRFDLVSWDPRGVGDTTPAPVDCPGVPDDSGLVPGRATLAQVATWYRQALIPSLAACQAANASIADHLGTREVVEDLDALRVAVGDEQLTYWGISYGTEIGYAYALAHPDRVRALVLDSPMDPGPWSERKVEEWATAAQDGYDMYAQLRPGTAAVFTRVLERLARQPIVLPDGTTIDAWSATSLVQLLTAMQTAYPKATQAISLMRTATSGSLAARDIARQRLALLIQEISSELGGHDWWVNPTILCADLDTRATQDEPVALAQAVRSEAGVPSAMRALETTLLCTGSPPTDPVPTLRAGQGPRVPLLVIGSTHDGRTNGAWVDRMTSAFPGARSITYDGGQHGLYRALQDGCVDAPVTRYLLTGRLPARDLACPTTYEVGGLVR